MDSWYYMDSINICLQINAMKKIWSYISTLLAGMLLGILLFWEMTKNSINTTKIKKQIQRNWRSTGNKQENTTNIKKRLFNKKRKKDGKFRFRNNN